MIGVDTTFLIDFFNGDDGAVNWMITNIDEIYLCEHVVYEFLCGNLSKQAKNNFLAFISQLHVFPFDRNACLEASEIFRKAKQKGKEIAHPDAVIAGTYKSNYVHSIVTRNSKHFKHVQQFFIKTY